MEKRCIIRGLERAQAWVKNPTGRDAGWQAEGIMIACFQLIGQTGRTDWLRDDRRRVLKSIQRCFDKPRGRRVLGELIDYTISCLLACQHVDEWWTTLNVKQRRMTAEHIQAIQESKQRAKREKIFALKRRVGVA